METQSPPVKASNAPARRTLRFAAIVAVAFTCANALWAAWDQDVTYDEPFHVGWARRLLDDRNDARDQFRFDSKTPALIPAVLLEKAAIASGFDSDQALKFVVRLPSIAALALLIYVIGWLARTSDPSTRWLAILVSALDPNIAAHASIATTDIIYSLVVLLFAGAALPSPSPFARAVLMGAVMGLAFAVKFTAVLLVPFAIILIATWSSAPLNRRLTALVLAAMGALLVVDVAYLGVGILHRLGEVPLESPSLRKVAGLFGSLPLPFPQSVLTGIDASITHNKAALWASYLFGAEHRGGVWFYFVAHWLMKTPVALILLVLTGVFRARRSRAPEVLIPALLLVLHLSYFSFFFATQIGLRFALPCIALAAVLAGRGLSGIPLRWILLATGIALGERLPYWSDPIAFTNISVLPKSRAWWYTADSNLDYGQNRERVYRYAGRLGEAFVHDQPMLTPGLFVLSANELTIFDSRGTHDWLRTHDIPAIRVGFTDFAFSITGDRFDQYLNEARTVEPSTRVDSACQAPLDHYPPGGQIPFVQEQRPGEGRLWIVCLSSRKGADVGFTTEEGRLWFGRVTPRGVCEADLLQKGQQAWFRVPRGTESRLCLWEFPNRRSELAYRLSGYITIRGQGADAALSAAPLDSLRLNAATELNDRK